MDGIYLLGDLESQLKLEGSEVFASTFRLSLSPRTRASNLQLALTVLCERLSLRHNVTASLLLSLGSAINLFFYFHMIKKLKQCDREDIGNPRGLFNNAL